MNRRGFFLAGSLFAITGCMKEHTTRLQNADDNDKDLSIRTIGDISTFDTAGRIPVSGVGMVVGLEGTGGGSPPGMYRDMMKEFLKRKKIEEIDKFLDSPNHALVLVSAEIPPGARPGQRIDVRISLPQGSKVRSLRGGYLMPTELLTYATSSEVREQVRQINPDMPSRGANDSLLRGSPLADAEGPLQIPLRSENDSEATDESFSPNAAAFQPNAEIRTSWIWRGARCRSAAPLYLVLNPDQERFRMAIQAADRINEVLVDVGSADKVAKADRKHLVSLKVPPQYRLNQPHYLRMLRMIPIERMEGSAAYRKKLQQMLLEPETTLSAALRLEALGRDSIRPLHEGLKSEYPLVRFASAESLAFLGEPIAASHLAKLALEHPSLQAYCLTALASLDEAAGEIALAELMESKLPEVRYGAFHALREMRPTAEGMRGVCLNQRFWLHRVAPEGDPMIHFRGSKRAEVVVFGKNPNLVAPFALRAGPEIIVSAKHGDAKVTISRISARHGSRMEQCSFAVPDIIRMMGELGANYSDIAQLLKQAEKTKALNCPLVFDAMPKAVPVKVLAEAGRSDPKLEREADLFKLADPDSSMTPNLYEQGVSSATQRRAPRE